MKIVIAAVCSADGLLTRGAEATVTHWSSKEDWEHFLVLRQSFNLLVMGRKTYEAVRPMPEAEHLRVVLTSRPADFDTAAVQGQLEFINEQPRELVALLEARGYTSLLLLGGGQVNGAFLAAGLGDELYLTVEPLLFGAGTPLLGNIPANVTLQLLESRQLNERGTMLLYYAISLPA